jgi:hypothetical protein
MSDPNSKSSDILSDGPVKDILRPACSLSHFYYGRNDGRDTVFPFRTVSKSYSLNSLFRIFLCPNILLLQLLEDHGREILRIKTANLRSMSRKTASQEELLPYDTNLFDFGLKIFWSFVFSFGIFKLINMLNEFNVTGVVQVVTTASLGIMPHIFNIVASKISEERKKALDEKLKLNVKYMVEDLIREDPELARTVLIKEEDNDDDTTSEENVHGYELVQVRSDESSV